VKITWRWQGPKAWAPRAYETRLLVAPNFARPLSQFCADGLIGLWGVARSLLKTSFSMAWAAPLWYQAIGLFDTPVIVGSTLSMPIYWQLLSFLLGFIMFWLTLESKLAKGINH